MPLFIIGVAFILWVIEPTSSELLAYERNLITGGQWWRIITGHLLHTNTHHLALNVAGLLLLWALHGQYYGYNTLTIMLILSLGTSLGIYIFAPNLVWYVGLSGILHGLFIIGAYFDITQKMKTGWLLFLAIWIKVIHEQLFGASQDVAELIGANVAIDAHLYGTISGCLIVLYFYFNTSKKQSINRGC